MGFIKGLSIFFLSIISIILLIVICLSFALNSFLYPEVYLEALESSGVYESIQDSIGTEEIFFILMPQGGPKLLVESLLTSFFAYIRSDTEDLSLVVKVDHQKIKDFIIEQIGPIKECNNNNQPFSQDNPCLPKGMDLESYISPYLDSNGMKLFNGSEIDLAKVYGLEKSSENGLVLDNLRAQIIYFKKAYLVCIVALFLIFSLIFLIQRNTNKFLRTMGIIFLIPSAIIYSLIYLITQLRSNNLIHINDRLSLSIYNTIVEVLSSKLLISILVMVSIAILSIVLSFIIKSDIKNNIKEKSKENKTKIKK